jgi:HEAT repeat protein
MRLALATVGLVLVPILAHAQTEDALDVQAVKSARLETTGPALLDFFRARTQRTADPKKVADLIQRLGDREAANEAFAGVVRVGMPAVPLLRKAANNVDEAEVAARARECLKFIEGEDAATLSTAAARLLVRQHPEGTVEALLGFLPFAENEKVAEEVEAALTQVAAPGGKVHPALLKAVKDEAAARRAVAADVICQVGDAEQRQAVKALLKDPGATVRFRVALALARRSDADAVPVLIDLLSELPPEMRAKCEEYLTDLAGDWAITVPGGRSPFEKRLRREVWQAWWKASEGPALLEEFRRRTLSNADRAKALALIVALGKEAETERDRAATGLAALGPPVLPLLRQALQDPHYKATETAHRCLEAIEKEAGSPLPDAAARLIALRKPEGAAEVLLGFIPYAEDNLADTLQEVLPDLVLRNGKAAPVFLKALSDPVQARRIAAARALAHYPGQQDPVRKLLRDDNLHVRLESALALASGGDRDAVPVLISLLTEALPEDVWQAEDYLLGIAGDKRPGVPVATDAASRQKARDAWAAWWKANGATARLPRRETLKRILGLTLIVEPTNSRTGRGRVVEVDPAGKTRWEIQNLQNPLDAQVVGPDRVLIVEYGFNKLTERDFKGNVKWEKQVVQPIGCERLRNGNTFIVCRNLLLEVNRQGREVVNIPRRSDYIMAGGRLRDGSYAFVNNQNTYVRLDRSGKELKSYRVPFDPVGGSFYYNVLPSGHLLVGQYSANKVFEVDRDGKRIWEARVTWPNMVTRLGNGNVVVASTQTHKVTELDRTGKVVREFHEVNMRPYVAYKR